MASLMATLLSGGKVVVPTRFNALSFWRTVREHRVTWYSGVPTMHQLLLARAHQKPEEAATLRFIRSCSAPLSASLIHKIEKLFGVPFVEAYGMTEASHQMTSNPLPPRHRKAGSVGVGTGLRISIMDRDGQHLGTNQRGEVAIQGANVFRGYENNPEANTRAFSDGWFRTGDEGMLDEDCYLHLTGRIKDIIIRGGENIAPHEVDEVLLQHTGVAAAVTFGYVHPTLGEEVAAAVVLQETQSAQASEKELMKHCHEHLADYKCPKKIYFVKSIPTTSTGKIRRRAVASALVNDGLGDS
jgi:acyl-CoA synthetase (AMP-forming)/AMP-acid ligase II